MAHKINRKYLRKFINYILFMIVIILMCIISVKLHNIYKQNKLSTSVLTRTVGSINYDDIDNTIGELTSNDYIIISYVKSEENRKIEKDLKKIIVDNNIQNNTYYLDITDKMLDSNFFESLNKEFKLNKKIISVPTILCYKDGKLIKILDNVKGNLVDDFNTYVENSEDDSQ